jgi:uncharacterized protein
VIDPNVWIAGLINPYSAPDQVIEAVMADRFTAVVCQELLDELTAVLARPKFRRWISLDQAAAFVETLGARAEHQSDLGPPERRVRDPDDDYLVALADAAEGRLVTEDADLLEAKLDPPATTPRELLDSL